MEKFTFLTGCLDELNDGFAEILIIGITNADYHMEMVQLLSQACAKENKNVKLTQPRKSLETHAVLPSNTWKSCTNATVADTPI